MKNIEIKLKYTDGGLNSHRLIVDAIQQILDEPCDHYRTIEISKEVSTADDSDLVNILKANYDLTVRQGWTGGEYGMRDGSMGDGLTLWVDASELPYEYHSKDYGHVYNFHHLLEERGKLADNIDGDDFIQVCEDMGLKVTSDNTYNRDNQFMFDVQFTVIENEKDYKAKPLMVVMYHCGGDARGNYTSKKVYQFESMDDIYSVIFPCEECGCEVA